MWQRLTPNRSEEIHLHVVEGFEWPGMPGSCVIRSVSPWWGLPKEEWSHWTDLTKSISKNSDVEQEKPKLTPGARP